jgi:putative transposase
MQFNPGRFYHVYNQGNDRQKLFDDKSDDYLVFLRLTRRYILPHVEIIAYCLMPNHFHMMVMTDERCLKTSLSGRIEINCVSFGFKSLLSSYTRIVNKRRGCSGSLFRQGTHARCLNDNVGSSLLGKAKQDELANVFHYIHNNPVEANMVDDPADWHFSSYQDHIGLRNGTLVNKKVALEFCLA